MTLIEFSVKTSADFKKARTSAWKSSPHQERDRLRLFVLKMKRRAYSWHTESEKSEGHIQSGYALLSDLCHPMMNPNVCFLLLGLFDAK